ncbi:MAG TPA: amidinotransferase, partial [Flavobacteriaceae bacterium]|nr:amidinotransferase [Flavobacteriaceae bacterium]
MAQITNTILMIRPAVFRMNEETAVNNYFQNSLSQTDQEVIDLARAEFDAFVTQLREQGIQIIVVDDDPALDTPDSIFPNNWISFHSDGRVALYPMFAENRRRERREEVLEAVEQNGFVIREIMDYTDAEQEGVFLEGTGSMILDRVNHTAY